MLSLCIWYLTFHNNVANMTPLCSYTLEVVMFRSKLLPLFSVSRYEDQAWAIHTTAGNSVRNEFPCRAIQQVWLLMYHLHTAQASQNWVQDKQQVDATLKWKCEVVRVEMRFLYSTSIKIYMWSFIWRYTSVLQVRYMQVTILADPYCHFLSLSNQLPFVTSHCYSMGPGGA